jgi:inosine-uridine nucleoside N-ribohydrolase
VKRIIIDTDTGVDDALAIILALRSPELRVEAITTVAGNVEVEKCTRNCLLLLDLLQPKQFPVVAQGAKKPLVRRLVTAREVHGDDGLGDIASRYPAPEKRTTNKNATEVILALLQKYPRQITIVAIGPLTNIAHALKRDFKTMKKAREIIIMGGAFEVAGNTGPVAEFNMYVDPEAADRVLHSGIPITLIPLDVTQQVVLRRPDVARLAHKGSNRIGLFIERMTKKYMQYHKMTEGFSGGYLHDPLAVGVAVTKRFVRCRDVHVEVETHGKLTRGMTVAELRPKHDQKQLNARMAFGVKHNEFVQFFKSRVWS